MRQLMFGVVAVAVLCAVFISPAPAMAQSNNERSMELNIFYGRGGISASGLHLPHGRTFGVSFEYPMFQSEKFALNSNMGFSHVATGALATDNGNLSISQTVVGGGMIVYAWPQKKFRPYGGFNAGPVSNTYHFGDAKQSRQALGMGFFGGFKFDIGKHISIGPRAGLTFSSAYGYDNYGNTRRESVRGSELSFVTTWRF